VELTNVSFDQIPDGVAEYETEAVYRSNSGVENSDSSARDLGQRIGPQFPEARSFTERNR
jgi:hypothetical protein